MSLFKKKPAPQKDANFYVYFPEDQKDAAEEFGKAHENQFATVKIWLSEGGDKKEWGVKLNRLVSGINEYHAVGEALEKDAKNAGGDYDGSEIEV